MLTHRDHGTAHHPVPSLFTPRWLLELKWDGYRVLALVGDVVRLLSRQGRDMAAAFPEVRRCASCAAHRARELVILGTEGLPQFDYLARAWRATAKGIREAAFTRPVTLIAFGILLRNDRPPYRARCSVLRRGADHRRDPMTVRPDVKKGPRLCDAPPEILGSPDLDSNQGPAA